MRTIPAVSRTWLTAPRLDTLLVVTPPQGGRRWPLSARELRSDGTKPVVFQIMK